MNRIDLPAEMFDGLTQDANYLEKKINELSVRNNSKVRAAFYHGNFAFKDAYVYFEGHGLVLYYYTHSIVNEKLGDIRQHYFYHITITAEEGVVNFDIGVLDNRDKPFVTLLADDDKNTVEWYRKFNHLSGWQQTMIQERILLTLATIEDAFANSHKTILKIQRDETRNLDNKKKSTRTNSSSRILVGGNSIIYTNVYKDTKHYKRWCEAWEVRGHYRHLRDGRIIFVHPYQKGKGRIKDKTYSFSEAKEQDDDN